MKVFEGLIGNVKDKILDQRIGEKELLTKIFRNNVRSMGKMKDHWILDWSIFWLGLNNFSNQLIFLSFSSLRLYQPCLNE